METRKYVVGCWDVVETHDPQRDYPYEVEATVRATDRTILDGVCGDTVRGRGKTPVLALAEVGLADA